MLSLLLLTFSFSVVLSIIAMCHRLTQEDLDAEFEQFLNEVR